MGLPADQETGSRRLNMEDIFVPLYLCPCPEDELIWPEHPRRRTPESHRKEREPVGKVLSRCTRLVILAPPGGGKTTLVRRLAIAYAFPDRRSRADDTLPDRPWLPLLIRCRQLGALARSPIRTALGAIPARAEMDDLADAFMRLVNDALRNGQALIMVDGLDEISDEGARVAFVMQLRIFLATYPTVNIVVTSREAGFRIIGGALSSRCEHFRIADFDEEDITRLTLAWHKMIVGDKLEVRLEAERLAKTICDSDRVRQLAKNPLLLTTLLLVKRWVGQLPRRRSVLYGKAIEVLLMTWNVEGYEPIDQEEAIPQLAFVAHTMMKEGIQRISARRLKEILLLARKEMPEILGYARFSVSEFIQRVELRSSLLILTGYQVDQGTSYAVYEFRHLTFQEYLAARAIADGYYDNRGDHDTILTLLEPHLADEHWKEVVPLAAVLAERRVDPLVRHLICLCQDLPFEYDTGRTASYPVALLSQCLVDEIQIAPALLKRALELVARKSPSHARPIVHGKYCSIMAEAVTNAYVSSNTDLFNLGEVFTEIARARIGWFEPQEDLPREALAEVRRLLDSKDPVQTIAGTLLVTDVAYRFATQRMKEPSKTLLQLEMKSLGDQLVPLLDANSESLRFAACWGFCWLGTAGIWSPRRELTIIPRLLEIWRESSSSELQSAAAWAIWALPLIDRDLAPLPEPRAELLRFLMRQSSSDPSKWGTFAVLVIGFYWKTPWDDEELAQRVAALVQFERSKCMSFLGFLGRPGEAQLMTLGQQPSPPSQGMVGLDGTRQ